jgi:hypothetical protein
MRITPPSAIGGQVLDHESLPRRPHVIASHVQAREAAERQPIALEMENRVVAPESAFNPLHSFDDPDYGFHFPEIRLLTWKKQAVRSLLGCITR